MGALDHLRVLELGGGVTAPFCARLFADLGAEVIKLEFPEGDFSRSWQPTFMGNDGRETSAIFHYLNAGKGSLVMDPEQAKDIGLLHTLLSGADVLIENLSPADREHWQLDFDSLADRHPHLVAVSLSPYGRVGPWSQRPGTDITAQASSSLSVALGMPGGAPLCLPFDQAEYQAAFHGFAAALSALYERDASGLGQSVDISVAQVMGYLVGGMSLVTAKRDIKWEKAGTRLKGGIYPTGLFECSDGFICVATQHPKQWRLLLELMGNPDWAADEKQSDAFYLGNSEKEEIGDIEFRKWLMRHSRAELLKIAEQHSIILGEVKKCNEVLQSEQFSFRDFWAKIPVAGVELAFPKPGYLFSKTPVTISTPAPELNSLAEVLRNANTGARVLPKGPGTKQALQGVRVLDFGWNWAGPMAGQVLADMGAEVIRIETQGRQDNMRAMDYASWFFCHNNRSKLSACFNIADPRGSALVRELVKQCDIVMDNFAVGVMAKNGLVYEDLKKANPKIIVVSMSMAGQQGPEKAMRGFASTASAYAGLEGMVGYASDREGESAQTTGLLPFGLGDVTQAIQGAIGALVALHHRNRSGEGQFVDMSLNESTTASMGFPLLDYQLNGTVAGPQGTQHPAYFPHGFFPAEGEDRWLALSVRDENDWRALCKVMERADWLENASLCDTQERRSRAAEINAGIASWCVGRDAGDAAEQLCSAGIPAAPQLELAERDSHPAFSARDFTYWHSDGSFDPCLIYNTPWVLGRTPPKVQCHAPGLGEQNDYVYQKLLGMSKDKVIELQEAGVLV